jgi:hypothetical protein
MLRVPPREEPVAMLHDYAGAYVGFVLSNKNAWWSMFEYNRKPNAAVPGWYTGQINTLVELVEVCFARLRKSSRSTTPRQAALLAWASLHGICSLEHGRLEMIMGRTLKTVVRHIVDVHIAAYRADARR